MPTVHAAVVCPIGCVLCYLIDDTGILQCVVLLSEASVMEVLRINVADSLEAVRAERVACVYCCR